MTESHPALPVFNTAGVRIVIVKHPYHVMRFYLLSSQDNHKRTSPLVFLG